MAASEIAEPGARSSVTVPDRPIPNPAAVRDDGEDGWTLLVNPDTAGAMAVNATGMLVWSLVDGKRTIEEIIAAVKDRFPNAPDTVRDDVLAYLTKLTEEGFIGQEIPFLNTNRRERREITGRAKG
jgi:hypothetical protein